MLCRTSIFSNSLTGNQKVALSQLVLVLVPISRGEIVPLLPLRLPLFHPCRLPHCLNSSARNPPRAATAHRFLQLTGRFHQVCRFFSACRLFVARSSLGETVICARSEGHGCPGLPMDVIQKGDFWTGTKWLWRLTRQTSTKVTARIQSSKAPKIKKFQASKAESSQWRQQHRPQMVVLYGKERAWLLVAFSLLLVAMP